MNLLYKSTRNSDKTVTASQAILKGLADDGGLFVPVSVPKLADLSTEFRTEKTCDHRQCSGTESGIDHSG